MSKLSLLEEALFRDLSDNVAAGTTAINSASVDTQGYDAVAFVVKMGTITDGTPKVKAQQSSDDGAGDAYADLAGSGIDLAATDDDKLVVLDVIKPQERYVRCTVDRTLGSPVTGSEIDWIGAILYRGRTAKVTQLTADVAGSETHVSPSEGTA